MPGPDLIDPTAQLDCLLVFAPCIIDVIEGGALTGQPFAEAVCDLLNQLAQPAISLFSKDAVNAKANGSVSNPQGIPQQFVAPVCEVDVIAQITVQSDAIEQANRIAFSIDKTQQLIGNVLEQLYAGTFSCAPINGLVGLLVGGQENLEQCKNLANYTEDTIGTLEQQLQQWVDYFNLLYDQSLLAAKWLQIFYNLGICNNQISGDIIEEN